MPDETLQVAFEIKTACDEISRKLLRWHWERKSGAHSLNALLEHIAQRQQESPEYYERMPDLSGRTSWSQLDTTLCMRVLLDPEKDAAHPLDLLGNTEHPGAARRACNAVRTARNEAAHASDRTAGTQAAILFNEAVEALEEGYAGTALRTGELEQYYRQAEEFLDRCGARKPVARASQPEGQETRSTGKPGTPASGTGQVRALWSTADRVPAARAALRAAGTARPAKTRRIANRGAADAAGRPARITRCWACCWLCWCWACSSAGWGWENETKTDLSGYRRHSAAAG